MPRGNCLSLTACLMLRYFLCLTADSSLVDLCHSGVSDVGASQVTHSMLDDQLAALGGCRLYCVCCQLLLF